MAKGRLTRKAFRDLQDKSMENPGIEYNVNGVRFLTEVQSSPERSDIKIKISFIAKPPIKV